MTSNASYYSQVQLSRQKVYNTSDSVKNKTKGELKAVVKEMLSLKEKYDKQSQLFQPSSTEQAKSLQHLSEKYDDFKLFESSTKKEMKRLSTKLTDITLKFGKVSKQKSTRFSNKAITIQRENHWQTTSDRPERNRR